MPTHWLVALLLLSVAAGAPLASQRSPSFPRLCTTTRHIPSHVPDKLKSAVCGSSEVLGRYCYGTAQAQVCLPGFVGVGFEGSSTNTLFELLQLHPGVCGTAKPESRLLFNIRHWPALLREQFKHSSAPCLRGEFTPGYVTPSVLTEIDVHVRDAQLLFPRGTLFLAGVRDPIERAHSQYRNHLLLGYDCTDTRPCFNKHFDGKAGTFRQAICYAIAHLGGRDWLQALQSHSDAYPYRENALQLTYSHWDLVSPGFYAELLRPWTSRLGRTRFLVYSARELAEQPAALLSRVFSFLALEKVDPYSLASNETLYAAARKDAPDALSAIDDAELVLFLRALYSNSSERTNHLFGTQLPTSPFSQRNFASYERLCGL